MRSESLLRKLGWKQSKGKWINENGHNKPLSLKRAKNALARDYGSKNFDSLKKKGEVKKLSDIVEKGYKPSGKGKFKTPKGRKEYKPDELSKKIEKDNQKELIKKGGFKSSKAFEKTNKYIKDNESKFDYFRGLSDEESLSDPQLKNLMYQAFKGRTKKDRENALDRLLKESGLRSGNEPWPAGQTPKRK